MRPALPAKVILRHCDSYEVERIRCIVADGLVELDVQPRGRTLVKPNVVVAGELFRHAHTRAEFTEGVLRALKERGGARIDELAVGERCGITIPTRFAFSEAGYDSMIEAVGARRYYFEEEPQVEVRLTHEKRLRDSIFTPEPVARADFFVNCPKFKAHPWTTVTFSMKNYIGIQDDRHRLIDHDFALDRKVADLQHVVQPEFIAIDAIVAGEGRMLTPIPRTLNLIVMGNNQVAIDATCCRILGIDPRDVAHIRMAYEDGFGPIDAEHIELSGDVSLGEAAERAEGFEVGLVRVEKYFEGTRISAYAGPPPSNNGNDYCWGGCPGALEEAIEVLRLYDEQCDSKMRRMHIVFGKYDGPLDVNYGEKVVFVGDCVEYGGKIGDQLVNIENLYKDRGGIDPRQAKHDDIYAKLYNVVRRVRAAKNRPYMRLEGCPVSVAELILTLSELGQVNNPYLSKQNIVGFNRAYLTWRAAAAARRLRGQPYQIAGETERGSARPELSDESR